MKSVSLATLLGIVSLMSGVCGIQIGPFGLYTKSNDPNWNMRYIDVGVRTGYNAIVDHISHPSQIPSQFINYYIDSDGTNNPTSSTGNLEWGAQTIGGIPYSPFWGEIGIFNPTSSIQPIYHDYTRQTQGYSTEWSIGSNGQLLLNGKSQFVGTYFQAPFWNYDAVLWNFGGNCTRLPTNTSAITLWKYP